LTSSATTVERPAEAAASFERGDAPGRAKNQVAAATATSAKSAEALKATAAS
jgi:hypothetical protein